MCVIHVVSLSSVFYHQVEESGMIDSVHVEFCSGSEGSQSVVYFKSFSVVWACI